MTEVGSVTNIDKKNRATVRFQRREACEHCRMCLKKKNEPYVELLLKNTLDAKVGDSVEVTMGANAVITASIIAYLMPIVLVGIALAATYKLGVLVSSLTALGVLILSEVLVVVCDRLLKKRKEYMPIMTAIIQPMEDNNNE